MSITHNIYNRLLNLKEIFNRKSFQNTFIGFLSVLMFFGVFNVYAQEEVKISPDWSGTKEFHNSVSGTEDPDEDNMNSRQGLEFLNTGWTAISLLAPEISENYVAIKNNENIPYDLRRGAIGMVEDAGDLAYASYPLINIPSHLAQQWVPGYDESTNSLYAYDNGYQELTSSGIVSLWSKTLNLAYLAFVVIMIVAGFMIMFRNKIGGQTMVTIGNVLPGIITSLIIATFSFAIAGLIIDIGGVITGLVAFILGDGTEIKTIGNLGGLIGTILSGAVGTGEIISGAVASIGIGTLLLGGGIGALLSGGAVAIFGGVVGILGILFALIVLGIILVGAIKVLITLYKAYFSLLLSVILGPIQITLGAMPGNGHMVKNWFLSILRNVLVFPVVLFIVNIPNAIANSGSAVFLHFPGKLILEETPSAGNGPNVAGGVFIFILKIFVLYFAAQAPKFLEAWFPANTPKAVGEGIASARGSMSKIPLIGGLFK